MELYTYFRSSSSYRVRIAMNLKRLSDKQHFVHLTRDGGAQHAPMFGALNPEHLVPVLRDGDATLTQSLAMLEYLEERHPTPALLPQGEADRAWVRALALQVACEIHPLNNLRVLQYLDRTLGISPAQKQIWIAHWIALGFEALETHLADDPRTGLCCFGDSPTIADCCLAPQIFNARRFGIALDVYPTLVRIDAHLSSLDAFREAAPGTQPDAE
ncbi:MAG: maleylacetoacetate isomerase [Polaromonas sp.]|nr:maleylacetoacetate isomerase [Polaromonas sp.]